MGESRYIPYQELVNRLEINRDDMLIITSDILPIALSCKNNNEVFEPHLLIESLQKAVGPLGTLLFPTFNWGFCRGETFDIRSTRSETGALSQKALNLPDFQRTGHPIYSFAVWGRYQRELIHLTNESSWGVGSPFDFSYEHNAKNIFLGIHYTNGFTFDHYCEEKVGVEYRFQKSFAGNYINQHGEQEKRVYTMFVRDFGATLGTFIADDLEVILREKGHYRTATINGIAHATIDLRPAVDIMCSDLENERCLVNIRYR